jgi:hypothetical protein
MTLHAMATGYRRLFEFADFCITSQPKIAPGLPFAI